MRNYLVAASPLLKSVLNNDKDVRILEIGCGNGSSVLPILDSYTNITAFAFDFSVEAIESLKERIGDRKNCHAFVHDVTDGEISEGNMTCDV